MFSRMCLVVGLLLLVGCATEGSRPGSRAPARTVVMESSSVAEGTGPRPSIVVKDDPEVSPPRLLGVGQTLSLMAAPDAAGDYSWEVRAHREQVAIISRLDQPALVLRAATASEAPDDVVVALKYRPHREAVFQVAETLALTAVEADLVAHRAGKRLGEAVTEELEDGGDPTNYVILVNDDYDKGLLHQRDFEAPFMALPAESDDDLGKITLRPLRPPVREGRLILALSNPTSARFFRADGGLLSDYTLDLTQPAGDLARLTDEAVHVWMEGLSADRHLTISLIYEIDGEGEVTRDQVHCVVARWVTIDDQGEEVQGAMSVSKDNLLAAARARDGAWLLPRRARVKTRIEGMGADNMAPMSFRSDSDREAMIKVPMVDHPLGAEMQHFIILYEAGDDGFLTEAEQAMILERLDAYAVPN